MADVISWVTTQLNPETMTSILDGVTLGTAHWAEVQNLAMLEGDQCLEQKVHVTAGHPLVEMHVTDWAKAQREDPMLSTVLAGLRGTEEDRFKGTSGRTHLQLRW